MMKREQRTTVIWAMCLGLFVSCYWMLSTKNGFLMDDYTTLVWEMFNNPADSFTIFPIERYNNRPVGRILVALLQDMFGVNYQGYHYVFVAIHLVNVFLVYKVAAMFFDLSGKIDTQFAPIIAAAIFGIYPQSIMAAHWVSAVCDLLGCLFALCALYAFLKGKQVEQYRAFYGIAAFVSVILSLRSKEMAILLPVFFLVLDIAFKKQNIQNQWVSATTIATIAYMIAYVCVLFSFPELKGTEYEQSFGLAGMMQNLFRYIGLYFDVEEMSMIFVSYNSSMICGIVVTLCSACYAVYLLFKKQWVPFVSLLGIGLILAPVLTLGNMLHKLYLYIPSVFVGLYFASLFSLLQRKFKDFPYGVFTLVCILVLTCTNYSAGANKFRSWWYSVAAQDTVQIEQLYRMGSIPEYCSIYVRGASNDYNAIYPYGPGDCLRFIYDRNDIDCYVVDEFPEQPIKPYILIDYEDGNFAEVSRCESYEIDILSIHSNWVGESLQLGVTCAPIFSDSQIVVNGKECVTIVGETFISTVVDKGELDDTDEIVVLVKGFGAESDAVIHEIPVEP